MAGREMLESVRRPRSHNLKYERFGGYPMDAGNIFHRLAFSILVILMLVPAAHSSTISTDAYRPHPGTHVFNEADSGTVSSYIGSSDFTWGYAQASASINGYLAGSAGIDGHCADTYEPYFSATATWTNTYTNNSSISMSYVLDYYIPKITSDIYIVDGQENGNSVRIGVMFNDYWILLGSFGHYVDLHGFPRDPGRDAWDVGCTYSNYDSYMIDGPGYGIFHAESEPYKGTLDLGLIAPGDSFALEYWITVSSGIDYGDIGNISLGDPTNLTAYNSMHGNVHPIPEPPTMLLLASGLASLVGYGRRRMKK